MTCEICSDAYGISVCENDCSYVMCSDCINKLECRNKKRLNRLLNKLQTFWIKLFL